MTKPRIFIGLFFLFIYASSTYAQFGKNQVRHENWTWQRYPTQHFSIYHYLDLNDPMQEAQLADLKNQLEMTYNEYAEFWNFQLSSSVPVIAHKTYGGGLDTDKIVGDFLPEGIGGVAESVRNRMFLRLDLPPSMLKQTISHELDHIFFYFQSKNIGPIRNNLFSQRPTFFIEGSRAMYVSNLVEPSTRDEIRRISYREIASNLSLHLPTWEIMELGYCSSGKLCSPYIYGDMVSVFVERVYGKEAVKKYLLNGTKDRGKPLFVVLNNAVGNKWESKEEFDEELSEYWEKYFSGLRAKSKFGADTENYISTRIMPSLFKASMVSPALSPDGTEIAFFSTSQDGIIIGKAPTLRSKNIFADEKGVRKEGKDFEILLKSFSPVPYEYIISQDFITWRSLFNGFDSDWSKDGKLAFFAKKGKDHALIIFDVKTKKAVKEFELPLLDQAFSPAFSQTGKIVYFSASMGTVRDIYSINIDNGEINNLTNDYQFDTAPSVSFDGNKIVYVSVVRDGPKFQDFQKLFILNLTNGEKKQITFGRSNENSPSFSDDGDYIAYTSDEVVANNSGKFVQEDRIWNLYTLNLKTNITNQWTDSYAGVFTPRFARGVSSRVFLVSWADRQFNGTKYPLDMVYELVLQKPLRTFIMRDHSQTMDWAFRTSELFRFGLDENQINNPNNFRRGWQLNGSQINLGSTTYRGVFGSSVFNVSDILEEHRHMVLTAFAGSLRIFDYTYFDLSKRKYLSYRLYNEKVPLYYQHYAIFKGPARQNVINRTWSSSSGAGMSMLYPLDKFNRFEFGAMLEQKSYVSDVLLEEDADPRDQEFYKFFGDSSRHWLSSQIAYVRDTIVYSNNTQGQYHGNALRVDFEVQPPIFRREANNISLGIDARRYMRLGPGSLVASRCNGIFNKHANGKYVLLGGTDTLRAYPYGSIAGNQIFYCSSEIRFPIIDLMATPLGLMGPIRGLIFADGALARFSNSSLPTQKAKSYGIGVQFFNNYIGPMNFIWARTDIYGKKWKFDMYLSYNW